MTKYASSSISLCFLSVSVAIVLCLLPRLNTFKKLGHLSRKTWAVKCWSTKLTLSADQAWFSLRFSIFTSNAVLKLHCRWYLRARKTRWPWFSYDGLLCCGGWRLENSREHHFHHILRDVQSSSVLRCSVTFSQYIPTLNGHIFQYNL